MDYSAIIKNSDWLYEKYKDLSPLEFTLSLHALAEYYERETVYSNDIQNAETAIYESLLQILK